MFGSPLSLGIAVVLKDGFSYRAGNVQRAFRSMEYAAYSAQRGMNRALGSLDTSFDNITRTVAAAGALLSTLAFPVREAYQFGKALSEVSTIADEFASNMGELRRNIMEQVAGFGGDLVNQTQGVYEAVSTGFLKTADASLVAREALQTGVVTMTDTHTMIEGLTGALNSYRLAATDAASVSDIFFQTIRYGKIRGTEMAKNFPIISAPGAVMKVGMKQLAGTFATMTLGGLPAEAGAQYFRQLLMGLSNPANRVKQAAKDIGVDYSMQHYLELEKKRPGFGWKDLHMEAYSKAVKKFGDTKGLEKVFGLLTGRQARTALAVLIQNRDKWENILQDMQRDERYDEYGRRYTNRTYAMYLQSKQLHFQLARLKGAFQVLGASLGRSVNEGLVPLVSSFATAVGKLGLFLDKHPGAARALTYTVQAIAASLLTFAGVSMARRVKAAAATTQLFAHTVIDRWLGVPMTLKNFIPSLTGAFLLVGGALAVYRRMLETNAFGIKDKIATFSVLSSALTEAFGNLTGAKGTISEDTYKALARNHLLGAFETWFRVLFRIYRFGAGVVDGVKEVVLGVEDAVISFMRVIGKGLQMAGLATWAQWVTDFIDRLSDANIDGLYKLGVAFGKLAGGLLLMAGAFKMWRGAQLVGGLVGALLGGGRRAAGSVGGGAGLLASAAGGAWNLVRPSYATQAAVMNAPGALWRWGRGVQQRRGIQTGLADARDILVNWGASAWRGTKAGGRAVGRGLGSAAAFVMDAGAIAKNAWQHKGYYAGRAAGAVKNVALNIPGYAAAGIANGIDAVGKAANAAKSGVVMFFGVLRAGLMSTLSFFLTNPIGLAILAIVAAIALLWWKWDWFKEKFASLWKWVKGVFTEWWAKVTHGGDVIKQHLGGAWDYVHDKLMAVWKSVKGFFGYVWNSKLVQWAVGSVSNALSSTGLTDATPVHTLGNKSAFAFSKEAWDADYGWLKDRYTRYETTGPKDPFHQQYAKVLTEAVNHIITARSSLIGEQGWDPNKPWTGAMIEDEGLRDLVRTTLGSRAAWFDLGGTSARDIPTPPPGEEAGDGHGPEDANTRATQDNTDAMYQVNRSLMRYRPHRMWELSGPVDNPYKAEQSRYLDLLAGGATATGVQTVSSAKNMEQSVAELRQELGNLKTALQDKGGKVVEATLHLDGRPLQKFVINTVEGAVETAKKTGIPQRGRSILGIPAHLFHGHE